MTPEEERTLREKFMAQRDAPEEDDAEDSFHGRGQLDQDFHDFLQDQEGVGDPEPPASAKPSSTVSTARGAPVKAWAAAMAQQFVASINAKAMQNDLPKPEK